MSDACQLCRTGVFDTVSERDRHGKPLKSVVCMGCGSVTNDPVPSDGELAAFYTSDYRIAYKGSASPRMRQVWRNFGRMEGHLRDNAEFYRDRKSCLDLGSGSGEFMFMAARMGIECVGVEPNRPYAEYTRETLGLTVAIQTLEETQFAPASFDLIRLSHVMEHMRDPVRSLTALREWLTDDGLIYIEVPNILFDAAHKRRGSIFHYGHIFNFNPWTFRAAARLSGFEEHPASIVRNVQMTGAFFRKGRHIDPSEAQNPENAMHVRNALRRHHMRILPEPDNASALARGVSMLRMRISERVKSRRFVTPRQIADHFAARIGVAA